MERSCNTTLVEVGLKLGREKLEEYMIDRFGFTPEENKFLDSAKARANGIIGQEIFKVSPLEMANMMATIARDGYHQKIIDPWQTRLVKEVRGRQSTITFSEIPEFQKIYNQKTAQALKDILKATNQKALVKMPGWKALVQQGKQEPLKYCKVTENMVTWPGIQVMPLRGT